MSLLDQIEHKFGYRFRDENYLHEATTTAGADPNNHDGNRRLAQVGRSFIELYLVKLGYISCTERGMNTLLKIQNINNDRCALIAKTIGLDQLLTYSPRNQHQPKRNILAIAVNALIGGIYIDSGSEDVTVAALEHIRWFDYSFTEASSPNAVENGHNSSRNLAELKATKQLRIPTLTEVSRPVVRDPTTDNAFLTPFLESETQRCSAHQMKPPQETYFNEVARAELFAVQAELSGASLDLPGLFFVMAGPHSIVGFQENIQGALAASNPPAELYYTEAPVHVRLAILQTLERIESHYDILKNYHTWQLFQSCAEQQESENHFIPYEHQPARQSGNPIHLRESRRTQRMLIQMFPESEQDPSIIEMHYNKLKALRRKGKRLHALINTFGLGILGLMYSAGDQDCLSDLLKIKISDRIFVRFISLLDTHQGALIREVSLAITPMVKDIIGGRLGALKTTWIKSVMADNIFLYPKGSQQLLQLLQSSC